MVQILLDISERTCAIFFAQNSLASNHFASRITSAQTQIPQLVADQTLSCRRRRRWRWRLRPVEVSIHFQNHLADGGGAPDLVPSWATKPSGGVDPAPGRLVAGDRAAPADLPCPKLRPCADTVDVRSPFPLLRLSSRLDPPPGHPRRFSPHQASSRCQGLLPGGTTSPSSCRPTAGSWPAGRPIARTCPRGCRLTAARARSSSSTPTVRDSFSGDA